MVGFVFLILPAIIISGLITLSLVIGVFALHAWLLFFVCSKWCSPQISAVIIALHIIWLAISYHHGVLYGYREILVGIEWSQSAKDDGIVSTMSFNIYHFTSGTRVYKGVNGGYRDGMDTARGPFELHMWGRKWNEDCFKETFPTERWALERLYQKLEIPNVSSYEEMYPIYLAKYTDPKTGQRTKGFVIQASQYKYRKTIETLPNDSE